MIGMPQISWEQILKCHVGMYKKYGNEFYCNATIAGPPVASATSFKPNSHDNVK